MGSVAGCLYVALGVFSILLLPELVPTLGTMPYWFGGVFIAMGILIVAVFARTRMRRHGPIAKGRFPVE